MACNCNNRNPKAWTDSNGCLRLNLDGRNFTYCPEGVSVACDPNGKGILINGQLCPFPEPGEASIVTDLEFDSDTNILTLRQENGPLVTVNLDDLAEDHYVESAEFDEETRILTLTRTNPLDPLTVEIPTEFQFPDTGTPYFLLQRGAAGGVLTEGRLFLGTMSSTPLTDDAIIMPGVPDGSPDTSAFRRVVATTEPTARTIAKRTTEGTLKAAPAEDPDDLVTLAQLNDAVPAGTEFDVLWYGEDGVPEAARIDLRHMVAEGTPLTPDVFLVPAFYYNSAGELSASGALPTTTVPSAYVIPTYATLGAGGVNRYVLQTNTIPRNLWFDVSPLAGIVIQSAPVTVAMFRNVIRPLYEAIEAIDPVANPATATVEDVAIKVNEVIATLKELLP